MTAKELLSDLNGFYPIDDSENPDYEKAIDILSRRVEAVLAVLESLEAKHGIPGLHPGEPDCSTCRLKTAVRRALDGEPEGER